MIRGGENLILTNLQAVSIQGSALILLVLLLRRLLRGHVSQRTIYCLWLPVLVRLVIPERWVRIPSPLSLLNAVQYTAGRLPGEFRPLLRNLTTGQVYVTETASPVLRAAAFDWQLIGGVVWLAGFLILTCCITAVNHRFRQGLYRTRRPLPLVNPLPVYAVPGLPSPCLAIVKKERAVYVPSEAARDAELLRHALAHENAHAQLGDLDFEVWRIALTAFFWWNPLVWLAVACSRQDAELACDEAALEALGEEERLAYGRTLVRLASGRKQHFICGTSMSHAGRALRERIRQIAHRPKHSRLWTALAVLVLLPGIVCAFTTAAAVPEAPSGDISAAISAVEAYIETHPVWQDAEVRYDAAYDRRERGAWLQYGGGAAGGYTYEDVIVLLCDFTAGDGPVLIPGERYTDYNFILVRTPPEGHWEIVDQGY